MEYRKIQPQPLTDHFGAVITGLDLGVGQLDHTTIKEIKDAFIQYQLLIFRDKILPPKDQIRFSQIFGSLEVFPPHPTQLQDYPEIFRLSTHQDEGYQNVGFYWHQDGSFRPKPTAVSIFHLIKIPGKGGETLFADAYEAYKRIPIEFKPLAEKIKTIHDGGIVHDLVIKHPVTGKKALYLNLGLVRSISGFDADEKERALELMDMFQPILDAPDVMYTHKWKEGDLIVADNYSVFHQATETKPGNERTLHRTSILGELTLNN